jgi:hypothetical protein
MTAASCFLFTSDPICLDIWVNSTTRELSEYEYYRNYTRIVKHPKYFPGFHRRFPGYDIALVFLDSPVNEVPLVVRNTNVSFPGNNRTKVTAIGFGKTENYLIVQLQHSINSSSNIKTR